MKENSIGDRIEEKYTRYLNCETDTLQLTIEEAIFILETDASVHYVEELLQEAYKVILSDYKRVLKENEELKLYNNSITSELEQMTTEKFKNGWFHQSEFKGLIPVQKVKDKIEEYKKMSDKLYIKFLKSNRYDTEIRDKGIKCDAIVQALQELLEGRK